MPRRRAPRWLREAAFIGIFVGLALASRASLADHYHVPSGSMLPAVELRDRVVVNKLAYGLRLPAADGYALTWDDPRRDDVVVLRSPVTGDVLLKRVVAVPGDLVEVRDGRVRIAGADAPDPAADLARGSGPDYGPVRLGPDRYLVLGDNRGDSLDGRAFGPVERGAILGKVVAVFYRGGPTWRRL